MTLLRWALVFALIAIIAGLLGFTGIAGASADIARRIGIGGYFAPWRGKSG